MSVLIGKTVQCIITKRTGILIKTAGKYKYAIVDKSIFPVDVNKIKEV